MPQQCFPLLVPIATSDQSVMEEEDHGRRKEVANETENWTQRVERGVGGVMNADEKSILPLLTTVTHPHHQHQCKKKAYESLLLLHCSVKVSVLRLNLYGD